MEKEEIPQNANKGCPGTSTEGAGKGEACAGCPNQKICSSSEKGVDPAIKDIEARMALVKHKIFILSGKGGVGKSTVTTQLGFYLAKKGFEVGIMDIDLCGPSIPRMFGLHGNEVHQSNEGWQPVYVDDNLGVMSIGFLLGNQDDAVIWRGPRKNGLIKQFLTDVAWGELDYLLIDTPPGTSDEHISIAQYLKTGEKDGAVIVTTPQEVALADVRKEISFCQKTNIKIIGVVENMSGFVCPHCKCESVIFEPSSGGAEKMCKDFNLTLLGKIPLDPLVVRNCDKGLYIGDNNKDSKVLKEYETIGEGIIKNLECKKE